MMFETAALRKYALLKYLGGMTNPAKIAEAAGVDGEGEIAIRTYFRSQDFLIDEKRARKDTAASVVDAIKEQLHAFLEEYIKLANNCHDPRVRASILKDLLEKGGAGATAKFSLTSPDAYRKKVEEYLEPDAKTGTDTSNGAGSAGTDTK